MKIDRKKSFWRGSLTCGRGNPPVPPSKRPSENLWDEAGEACVPWAPPLTAPPPPPHPPLPRTAAPGLEPGECPSCPGSWCCALTSPRRVCPLSQLRQEPAQHSASPARTEGGLQSVSRGTSVSACFYFKAWRQLKTSVWCQYFFFFFPTVHAILRNSWAGGGVSRLWNLFLRVATTYFSCGGSVLLFLGSAVRLMRPGLHRPFGNAAGRGWEQAKRKEQDWLP